MPRLRPRPLWSTSLLMGVSLLASTFVSGRIVEVSLHQPSYTCGDSCLQALIVVTFSDVDPEGDYYKFCQSEMMLTSFLDCMETYCSPEDVTTGWNYEKTSCDTYGPGMPAIEEIRPKLDALKGNISTVNTLENAGMIYNWTILPDQTSFETGLKTLVTWNDEMNMHHAFGWSMYILTGMMVLVGFMNRLFTAYQNSSRLNLAVDLQPGLWSKVQTKYQRYLGSPALFGYKHMHGWWWVTIPTRIQTLFIFLYVLINIIFCLVGYQGRLFNENLYWPGSESDQIQRYIADRTGIICFYNLPLLFLFAGRNDIFIWLTGWTYASMSLFHRWIGKVATIQALVHSLVWAWIEREYLTVEWGEEYWKTGIFGMITMMAILPLSLAPLRQRVYEFFLAAHFVFALATLVLLFYHVKIFAGDYDIYLWFCVGVWGLERLARIGRMIFLSHDAFLHLKPNTIAHLTSDKRGLIRLNITCPRVLSGKPGQHYYIYTPRQWTFWENHPFSIASWRTTENGTELSFLFAPQKGTTGRIHKQLMKSENGTGEMRLLLEGPYGATHNLSRFQSVLFVVGGSGVTAALPYLYEINRQPEKYAASRVVLIWAVKNLEYAADVLSHELAPMLGNNKFNIRIHRTLEEESSISSAQISQLVSQTLQEGDVDVGLAPELGEGSGRVSEEITTSSEDKTSTDDKELKSVSLKAGATARGYELAIGRPIMVDALKAELAQLEDMSSLAVLSCGPAGMLDDMRQAVSLSYGEGKGQVQASRLVYIEDHFGW